jgi:hypothetical protein
MLSMRSNEARTDRLAVDHAARAQFPQDDLVARIKLAIGVMSARLDLGLHKASEIAPVRDQPIPELPPSAVVARQSAR